MNFILEGRLLKYVNEECILYKFRNIYWKELSIHYQNDGYKVCNINRVHYLIHRIIGYLFLGLDINNEKEQIDHINGIRNDNRLENLRIVSNQQNSFNQKSKGFTKCKNKFRARIKINNKNIHLGSFETEEEAREAYLKAKELYHVI